METKVFEIRDIGTFMVGVATKLDEADPDDPDDNTGYLLSRYGFKRGMPHPVLLYLPSFKQAELDPIYGWNDKRTVPTAHKYIEANWAQLKSGDIVDVRFILGETDEPCESERVQWLNYISNR